MPIPQSLRQQKYLERQSAPITNKYVTGMSGSSEGVPKFHPLKSSNPVIKAGSLLHNLRVRKFSAPKIRIPKIAKIRL